MKKEVKIQLRGLSFMFTQIDIFMVFMVVSSFSEYYPNCEIQFMNLANIHTIRKSFHALRALCAAPADQPK